jgi:hypothetical protein
VVSNYTPRPLAQFDDETVNLVATGDGAQGGVPGYQRHTNTFPGEIRHAAPPVEFWPAPAPGFFGADYPLPQHSPFIF